MSWPSGPTPPPRPTFEQFLFVQPNFEVIAYRQGLTPQLVGRLSRFAWWSQIGAALELKLTRESIVLGLDGGLTAESDPRDLDEAQSAAAAAGVTDAVRNWANRRERVTYYAAATLIEFGSAAERDAAAGVLARERSGRADRGRRAVSAGRGRADRPVRPPPPDQLARLSPAAGDLRGGRARRRDGCRSIPADRTCWSRPSSRDSPTFCLRHMPSAITGRCPSARQFLVTPASLRRGMARGISAAQLAEWYDRRTGGDVPPAVRLLLAAKASRVPALKAARMLVLDLPTPELLDGLLQHPATAPLLGRRLGPTSVAIADDHLPSLQNALKDLGITLQ